MKTAPFVNLAYETRAKERHRRLLLTTFASVGGRLVSLLTVLISVPLTANYLGTERYGLWAAIGSSVALLSFADFGIGNGLLNAITECHGRDDPDAARQYVASSFAMLTGIATLLGLTFFLLYPWISWKRIFNVSDPLAVAEAGPATALFFICFITNIPLGVIQRVQQGYQEGFIDSAWTAASRLLGLMGLLIVVQFEGGLPWLVLAVVGLPVLVTCANGVALFFFRKPALKPRLADIRWNYVRRLFDTGFLFFIVQTAAVVAFSADNLILAHLIGPNAVTQYAIIHQMFSLGPVLFSMFLNALWPAYGEAIVRGDSEWVRATFRRSITIGLCINVPYALLLIIFGNAAAHLWVGDQISASSLVLLAFGIWTMMNGINGPVAVFLNGANAMRFEAICGSLMACLNLVLSISLTQVVGLSGVIWGSIIAQAIVGLVPSGIYIARFMRRFTVSAMENAR